MRLLSKMRKERAIYWPPGVPGADGSRAFGSPVELRVRWEGVVKDKTSIVGTTPEAQTKVYVGEDVEPGGALMYGTLADVLDVTNPFANPTAWEIKSFEKTPTLKADDYLRIARI